MSLEYPNCASPAVAVSAGAATTFGMVISLVISRVVFAPEPYGFPDGIAEPIDGLRVRLFTVHFCAVLRRCVPA